MTTHSIHVWYISLDLPSFTMKINHSCRQTYHTWMAWDGMGTASQCFTYHHISLGCEDQMLNHLKPTWNQRWITERACSSLFWTHRFGGSKSQSIHVCHIYLVLKNNIHVIAIPYIRPSLLRNTCEPRKKNNNSSFPLNPGWLIGIPDAGFMVYEIIAI